MDDNEYTGSSGYTHRSFGWGLFKRFYISREHAAAIRMALESNAISHADRREWETQLKLCRVVDMHEGPAFDKATEAELKAALLKE